MPALNILLDGEGAWPDLPGAIADGRFIHLAGEAKATIACLSRGMASGRPSVAIRLDLPDGKIVVYETSLVLLLSAADAFKARYGDPRALMP